jgi:hypothetical protein
VGAGSADPSPHKTTGSIGSPLKAPKVAGAAQASADPGVTSADKVCVCVCVYVCVCACVCVCLCTQRPLWCAREYGKHSQKYSL